MQHSLQSECFALVGKCNANNASRVGIDPLHAAIVIYHCQAPLHCQACCHLMLLLLTAVHVLLP
jgi:hypothetical protein